MSEVNITRNTFLEKEELLRFQQFLINSSTNQTFLANTTDWGIIDTTGEVDPPDFRVEVGSSSGTIKIVNLSRGLTKDGLLIRQEAFDNLAVTDDSNYYWIKISHKFSNVEQGTCQITADGQVAGAGTAFTDVLRGQSTEVPVKIKFVGSTGNTNIYEVVDVLDDDNIILAGDDFTPEIDLQYYVIGSTPVGESITAEQQNGLYQYDDTQLDFVIETVSDTEPAGKVQDEQFWVARVRNVAGTVSVVDKRDEYWQYFIKGVSDKLTKSENLADVDSIPDSRSNLGVYSTSEVDAAISAAINPLDDSGWKDMTRNSSFVLSDGFSMKIRRRDNIVNIVGTMKIISTPTADAELASIAYSTLGLRGKPSVRVYDSQVFVTSSDSNRGIDIYIDETDATVLRIKIINAVSPSSFPFYFNISYFGD